MSRKAAIKCGKSANRCGKSANYVQKTASDALGLVVNATFLDSLDCNVAALTKPKDDAAALLRWFCRRLLTVTRKAANQSA